ncbi:MAG: S41 family peptidase [Ignavibacteriaceae bacterium]
MKSSNRKSIKKKIVWGLTGLLFFSFFGFVYVTKDVYFEISKNIDIFTRVYKEITFNYVDEINPEKFLRAGIKGMLSTLDPYTNFIDEKRQDDLEILTNGKYGGIGVSIGVKDNQITIFELMEGYAAQRQGLRVGDIILEVNDKKVSPEKFDEISSLVKGEPGTFLGIKVFRETEKDTLKFNLIREEIVVKNLVYYGFYPEDSNTAYFKLNTFGRSLGDEVKKAILELSKQKEIKSVVLDLRGNPGGLLDVAVDVVSKFISKGELVVTTKGRDTSSLRSYYSQQEPLLPNADLLLLINNGSASASEIVAGAIQDHDRGIIVGTKSFGKGLVQTVTPLSYNTSLKITSAKYFTPSGRCIQKIDYGKKNDVVASYDTLIESTFTTDHKRRVFSSGGITPDSIVQDDKISSFVQDILAKGLLFKFANIFYDANQKEDFGNLKEEKILSEFKTFLQKENYKYQSEIEKKVNELVSLSESDKSSSIIQSKLVELQKEFKDNLAQLVEKDKRDIGDFLKEELASRYLGMNGRVKASLQTDKQFQAGLKLLNDKKYYDKVLRKGN